MFWQNYFQPTSLDEALQLLQQLGGQARVVAGGTDVLVELSRGVKPTSTLIDISRLSELKYVRHEGDLIRIGGLATHNDVIASEACVCHALPLAQACWEIGAPQIRTRATVAGNLITASPANDTITPLMALNAEVVLASAAGERVVLLHEFYPGFRQTVLQPNELLREIRFPALRDDQRGLFLKLGLRRAQAISVIDIAIVLEFEDGGLRMEDSERSAILHAQSSTIREARIALGCVAPTIIHAPTAESFLKGKTLDPATCAEAGRLAAAHTRPIGDVRGSASYRRTTVANLVAEGLQRIAAGSERTGWPEQPVLLETDRPPTTDHRPPTAGPDSVIGRQSSVVDTIETTINGQPYTLSGEAPTKSLLDALREDAGLTGTKEGCAEGECGACTVWLNGQAVMACLTPAGQAHGAAVTTIEGLAATRKDERRKTNEDGLDSSSVLGTSSTNLHPLQQAFIANAAVQCGYCIPGMLMAGAKLLDERAQPTIEQAQVALSGNICRCTGYRKILDAVLSAAAEKS
jgi:xanthine dehydrogenase iron-sulfur cluster and FAD-binding subunit A